MLLRDHLHNTNRLKQPHTFSSAVGETQLQVDPIDPATLSPSIYWAYGAGGSTFYRHGGPINAVTKGDTTVTVNRDSSEVSGIDGSFSWSAPSAGTTAIAKLRIWGGGCSGQGDDTFASTGGSGGGGGAYGLKSTISITASTSYSGVIGAGGAVLTTPGVNPGEASSFVVAGTTYSVPGGVDTSGGTFSNAVNMDSGFDGGSGGTTTFLDDGGSGGGGGAGTAANGKTGSNAAGDTHGAGAVAVTGGGAGGDGGDDGQAGSHGAIPGGGGGGGGLTSNSTGQGGSGQVVIEFVNTGITITSGQTDIPTLGDKSIVYGTAVGGYNTTGTVTWVGSFHTSNILTHIVSTAYSSTLGAGGHWGSAITTAGTRVTIATDISGNSNHISCGASNAKARAGIVGTGISSGAAFVAKTSLGALAAYTTFDVLQTASGGTSNLSWGNSTNGHLTINSDRTLTYNNGTTKTTTTGTVPINQDIIVCVRAIAGSVRIRATGGLDETKSTTGSLTVDRWYPGAFVHSSSIIFNSALSTPNINGVIEYLQQKYGVTNPFVRYVPHTTYTDTITFDGTNYEVNGTDGGTGSVVEIDAATGVATFVGTPVGDVTITALGEGSKGGTDGGGGAAFAQGLMSSVASGDTMTLTVAFGAAPAYTYYTEAVNKSAVTIVKAQSGQGTPGGLAANCVGTTKHSGGSGATGQIGGAGGGGGGGTGGSAADGNNGTANSVDTGGAGGVAVTDGYAGGAGGNKGSNGSDAPSYGGGGGGAATGKSGGAGGPGVIFIAGTM